MKMKRFRFHKNFIRFLLLFSALLFYFPSKAQHYKTVYPNSESYFINQNGLIKAIYIDSSVVVASDTFYFNFNSIRVDTLNCTPVPGYDDNAYTPYGASWLGKYVMIQPDGYNLFFNKSGDTIFIKTQAELNDSWKLFMYQNGEFIEATVSEISIDTFFGLIDSTKTVSLQLKDSLENDVQHDINSKTLVLSQHHALLKTFDFYEFPGETMQYAFTDKKRLTNREVYDFEIGDERQVYGSRSVFYYSIRRYKHEVILDKYFSSQQDTLFYKIQIKIIEYERILYEIQDTTVFIENVTIDTIISAHTRLDEPIIMFMPEESISDNDLYDYLLYSIDTFLSGKRYMIYGNWSKSPLDLGNDTCWQGMGDGQFEKIIYIEGLGTLYDSFSISGHYRESIIYYKKGTEIYGEFYTYLEETPELKIQASIYPNPVSHSANVEFTLATEDAISISLFDMYGKKIKSYLENEKMPPGKNHHFIAFPEIPQGIYLLEIASESSRTSLKVVKTGY